MPPLKVKILGLSGNAGQKHARAFEALPELYQITDSDNHDIVSVCTPNSLHFEQTCEALGSGKHAIVEKPLCASLKQCELLNEIASVADSSICPIFQYRFAGHDPVTEQIISPWRRDHTYYAGWRGEWNAALGGVLTSHGIHLLDLVIQAYGMPERVSATLFCPANVETKAYTTLYWRDHHCALSVQAAPDLEQGGFNLGDSNTGYVNQFRMIHDSLIAGSAPPVTLEEARQSLEVLTACYASAYAEQPVMLPLAFDHAFYQGWSRHFQRRQQQFRSSQKISV